MVRKSLLLLTALVLVNCDELLPPGDQTTPEYWGAFFLDKYADELVVGDLEPGPPRLDEPRTVLLITGVTIPAQWFDPIVARLTRDGFVPVVYEPPDLLSYDLFEASEDLAAVVEQVLEESGQERIDILAECTGGLIARYYIQSLGGDAYVNRMVTFVSPQHGVDKAPLAAIYAGWPALFDLSPGSEFLDAVNDEPLPADVAFTSIYTCGDEYIQPYETSIIPGANNIGLCDEFVGHFQTFYDPAIYAIMHAALTEATVRDPAPAAGGEDAPDSDNDAADDDPGLEDVPAPDVSESVASDSTDGDPASTPTPPALRPGDGSIAESDPALTEGEPDGANPTMGCNASGAPASWPALVALALLWVPVRRRRADA